MKFLCTYRNPKTGEHRTVVVELNERERAMAARGPGGMPGLLGKALAFHRARDLTPGLHDFLEDLDGIQPLPADVIMLRPPARLN